jgi:RNA polymerase sigma-70 factor (ECF subfamily)
VRRSDDPSVSARFAAAYDRLSPWVLGYLKSHGVDDPESVTSDVFLALYQNFDRITGGDDEVRTLTFSIAHARLVDYYRMRATRPATVLFEAGGDPRTTPSAEETASSNLSENGLTPLLNKLGHDQREVIVLRVIAGLSLEETARVMQKSIGAIKQLQRRALESLRVSLGRGDGHV